MHINYNSIIAVQLIHYLYSITKIMHYLNYYPHIPNLGSTDVLPFVTMGSGSLAAMAVFEKGYSKNINVSTSFAYCTYIKHNAERRNNIPLSILHVINYL